ncbi:hypothetical protein HanHA300_Chr04g0134541 [Helianthus annuus]|nr:hypothetical protein HanHA300_Chr04g0134541 [Helianthus annuus]KAJ0757506.1 hypothetical protein HanLR1_Chr04g0139511 [Helianthus annuus]
MFSGVERHASFAKTQCFDKQKSHVSKPFRNRISTNSNGLPKGLIQTYRFLQQYKVFETCMSFNDVGKGPRTWAKAQGHGQRPNNTRCVAMELDDNRSLCVSRRMTLVTINHVVTKVQKV